VRGEVHQRFTDVSVMIFSDQSDHGKVHW
jgi:hypothetical protein